MPVAEPVLKARHTIGSHSGAMVTDEQVRVANAEAHGLAESTSKQQYFPSAPVLARDVFRILVAGCRQLIHMLAF